MKTKFDFKSIKTFEDACKKEGINPLQLPDMSMIDLGMGKALLMILNSIPFYFFAAGVVFGYNTWVSCKIAKKLNLR